MYRSGLIKLFTPFILLALLNDQLKKLEELRNVKQCAIYWSKSTNELWLVRMQGLLVFIAVATQGSSADLDTSSGEKINCCMD